MNRKEKILTKNDVQYMMIYRSLVSSLRLANAKTTNEMLRNLNFFLKFIISHCDDVGHEMKIMPIEFQLKIPSRSFDIKPKIWSNLDH